jgi:hypothetical protein
MKKVSPLNETFSVEIMFVYLVFLLYSKYNHVELIAAAIAYEANTNINPNTKSFQLPDAGNHPTNKVRK